MLQALGRIAARSFFHHPIVVLGHGRSGTTALFGGLIQHPEILGARSEVPLLAQVGQIAHDCELGRNHAYLAKSLALSKQRFYKRLRQMLFELAFGRFAGAKTRIGKVIRGDRRPSRQTILVREEQSERTAISRRPHPLPEREIRLHRPQRV